MRGGGGASQCEADRHETPGLFPAVKRPSRQPVIAQEIVSEIEKL